MNFKETLSRAHIGFISSSYKQLPNINVSWVVEQQRSHKQHQRPAPAERQLLQGRSDPGRAAPPPAHTQLQPGPSRAHAPAARGVQPGRDTEPGRESGSFLTRCPQGRQPPGQPTAGLGIHRATRTLPPSRPPARPASTCSLLRSRQGGSVPSPWGLPARRPITGRWAPDPTHHGRGLGLRRGSVAPVGPSALRGKRRERSCAVPPPEVRRPRARGGARGGDSAPAWCCAAWRGGRGPERAIR